MMLASCSTSSSELAPLSSVSPTVASEGTLANHVLAQDASLAIREIEGSNKPVVKFVLQEPVGMPGNKAWREMWIFDPEGVKKHYIVTFREDGQGSANFELQRM